MADTLQPVYTPFSAGIDTQSHPQNIRAPYLRHAQNVDFRRDIGPQKREGLAALPKEVLGGGTITNGGQLLTVGDELLCADDQAVYSWSPQHQRWVGRGELRPVAASTKPLAVSGAQITMASATAMPAAGLDGCAWMDAAGVHVCVVDTATGTRVVDDLLAATGRTSCRLLAGATFFVLFTGDAAGNVYAAPVLTGQATMGTEVAIAANVQNASQAFWDVAVDSVTDGFIFAYQPSGVGTYNVRQLQPNGAPFGALDPTTEGVGRGFDLGNQATLLTVATDILGTPSVANRVIMVTRAYSGSGTGYYGFRIEWMKGTVASPATRFFNLPASGVGSLPGQGLAIATVQINNNGDLRTAVTCAVTDPLLPSFILTYQVVNVLSVFPLAPAILPNPLTGVRLLSRPFFFGPQQRLVAWCLSATLDLTLTVPQQPTAFLMDLNSGTFMARLAIGTLDSATILGGVQLQQPVLRGAQWGTGALVRVRSVSGAKGTPGAIASSTLVPQSGAFMLLATPVAGRQLQAAALDSTAIFASGVTYQYDGAAVVEQGFFEAPNLTQGGAGTGSGGAIGPGTYQWTAVWEWYDARGKRHRSAPATPVTQVIAGPSTNWTASFFCTPLRLTRKRNVALVLYRTTANGTVFFQVTDSTIPYLNNTSVNFLFPMDGLADSAILGNEVLYTGGGELPNDAPPASTVAVRARSRILLAGGDYPDTITYSKQNDVGNGVQFSLGLQKRIAAVPGSIVAMAALDDKVIVFKTQGICAFAGTGVTSAGVAAGQNDDFTDPIILATDLFCTGANAVTTANEGVYFQSQKGIYLLDRSLGFTYVGSAAETYNRQTVVSANLHPRLGHVRFGCLEDTGLVYHPRKVQPFGDSAPQAGAWTTYTNWAGVSATVWQGQYVLLRADGTVVVDGATYDDTGAAIVQSLRTGWLTGTAPLQAARFGALAVIGNLTSPHRLQVDLAISYDSTPVARLVFDTALSATRSPWGSDPTWGNAAAWGQDTVASYIFRCRELPEQVMSASAVQWTFSDATPTDGTLLQRGTSLHGYAMLVEPLAALPSLPDKQSL